MDEGTVIEEMQARERLIQSLGNADLADRILWKLIDARKQTEEILFKMLWRKRA